MPALDLVASISGWLRPEDAEKLYELAGSTHGPILEVGTHHGKSAVLMALATRDAGRPITIFTLDVDREVLEIAAQHAREFGVADQIVFVRGTLVAFARAYPHLRPTLIFVDADHSADAVRRDLAVLDAIVPAGAQMVFHDFNDPSNDDPACREIKVRPTVESSWISAQCRFEGTFGACGLYTRQGKAPERLPVTADLLRLDSLRDQYLYCLRHPAGRLWQRLRPKRPS